MIREQILIQMEKDGSCEYIDCWVKGFRCPLQVCYSDACLLDMRGSHTVQSIRLTIKEIVRDIKLKMLEDISTKCPNCDSELVSYTDVETGIVQYQCSECDYHAVD